MDVIEFRDHRDGVGIFVNGARFQDLAEAESDTTESPRMQLRDFTDLRRSQLPLPGHWYGDTDVLYSAEYERDEAGPDDEDPVILACACGEWGCGADRAHHRHR